MLAPNKIYTQQTNLYGFANSLKSKNIKITMNGLRDEEFYEISAQLCKDAAQLLSIANSTSGHLGDIVSGIRTIQSSMELKAKKLWEIFEEQKKQREV